MVRKVSTSTMRDGSFPFGNGTGKPTLVGGHLPLKFQWITHTKRLRGQPLSEFGARRWSQHLGLSFPSSEKVPTPLYTDTEAALFTEVEGEFSEVRMQHP